MINKRKAEVRVLNDIGMSAHKARRVIDQIRGRSYEKALMILAPYQEYYPILKLLFFAVAKASYIMGSKKTNLQISKVEVNEGTAVKKLKPRFRGRIYPIKGPSCHISIVIKDTSLDEYRETYKDTNKIVVRYFWTKDMDVLSELCDLLFDAATAFPVGGFMNFVRDFMNEVRNFVNEVLALIDSYLSYNDSADVFREQVVSFMDKVEDLINKVGYLMNNDEVVYLTNNDFRKEVGNWMNEVRDWMNEVRNWVNEVRDWVNEVEDLINNKDSKNQKT